jgi:leucyl aminopeptidase
MYNTLLNCFNEKKTAISIQVIFEKEFDAWVNAQNNVTKAWVSANNFREKKLLLLPKEDGSIAQVAVIIKDANDWMSLGGLPMQLPEGDYQFNLLESNLAKNACLAWGMGAYQFTRYKKAKRTAAQLCWPAGIDQKETSDILAAIYLVRDLVNTPAEDMHPEILANVAKEIAQKSQADFHEVTGEALKNQFPCVYHVGKASAHKPRLIELRWGKPEHRKITLVGKGVCFDTGGLNLKNDAGMLMMKKDMGGAAHVLALAQLVMAQALPIQLRVLIPAVENAVSGEAYKPGDILTSRTGKTIEITNTDAEGRLILCDALAAAAEENPEWIIDFATLTGAAKVAVGTELAAFFTSDENLMQKLMSVGNEVQDPCWPLPLHAPYRALLDSAMADMINCSLGGYAGAITAALFLQAFIPQDQPWIHFDIMASNLKTKPGKPEGGEAMGLRAVYELLKQGK